MPTGYTITNVVNLALREIGTYRIEDISERSPEARTARDVWDQALVEALEAHEWNWAKTYASLARENETPTARWEYSYALPSDFIRLGAVADNDTMRPEMGEDEFEFMDGSILTDAESVYISYVYKKDTVGLWPGYFVDYMAKLMAVKIASVLKSTTEKGELEKLRYSTLGHSRSLDSVQSGVKVMAAGNWRQSMFGNRKV